MQKELQYIAGLLLGVLLFQACSAQQTHLVADEIETVTVETLQYYLYYPEDYEARADENFPILLFLHGGLVVPQN